MPTNINFDVTRNHALIARIIQRLNKSANRKLFVLSKLNEIPHLYPLNRDVRFSGAGNGTGIHYRHRQLENVEVLRHSEGFISRDRVALKYVSQDRKVERGALGKDKGGQIHAS